MISSVFVKNFKCFRGLSLPLGSLTLLTGYNAAGKSTSLHGLLLLAQAFRQGGNCPLLPINGGLVRLGTAGDVFGGSDDAKLKIGIKACGEDVVWTFGHNRDRSGNVLSLEKFYWNNSENEGDILIENNMPVENLIPKNYSSALYDFKKCVSDVVLISAIRSGVNDVFRIPDIPEPVLADVGITGENAAWLFSNMMDEDVDEARWHKSEKSPILRKQFNAWAGDLFPGAQANAQRILNTDLVRIEFRKHETDQWRRPANIGYGLSYVFPIIVAGLLARKGQTLIIDSPEAHLHPMGQSRIGRFLATVANSGVQVIIETHSDHLLNGVRLAVRDKELRSTDLMVHFFNESPRSSNDPAHVVTLQVDESGAINNWPQGFFDQSENDLSALAGWDVGQL